MRYFPWNRDQRLRRRRGWRYTLAVYWRRLTHYLPSFGQIGQFLIEGTDRIYPAEIFRLITRVVKILACIPIGLIGWKVVLPLVVSLASHTQYPGDLLGVARIESFSQTALGQVIITLATFFLGSLISILIMRRSLRHDVLERKRQQWSDIAWPIAKSGIYERIVTASAGELSASSRQEYARLYGEWCDLEITRIVSYSGDREFYLYALFIEEALKVLSVGSEEYAAERQRRLDKNLHLAISGMARRIHLRILGETVGCDIEHVTRQPGYYERGFGILMDRFKELGFENGLPRDSYGLLSVDRLQCELCRSGDDHGEHTQPQRFR